MLFIWIANYPDWPDPSGNFVENSTKLICFDMTSYQIEYSTVKCCSCLGLHIRHGQKVYMQAHTINSNSQRGSQVRQGIPKFQMY
jgi:hypothetical protein